MKQISYWIAGKFYYFFTAPRYKNPKKIVANADKRGKFVLTVEVDENDVPGATQKIFKALGKDTQISDLYQ